jgi:RNA polymerase sigma factor (sigma-70 family)
MHDVGSKGQRHDVALGESFEGVIEAARAGGDWAWAALYRNLAPAVLGYLRAQGASEPEDLLGEVFVQVVRGLSRFEGDEAGFRSWVFVIAHHRLLDERRALSRRAEQRAFVEVPDAPSEQDVCQEALNSVATDRVRRILDRLPPAQREVLLMRILGGLTVEDVARAVGKRVGATKALQRRGLAAVKRELEREGVPL